MQRSIDKELNELKNLLVKIAGYVEEAIELAVTGLESKDRKKISGVFELEEKINDGQIAVDEACVSILARQHPLAGDLRMIIAIIKINTDLERMGDQAVNIAYNAEEYLKATALKPLVDLPVMFHEVRIMVREAIECFAQKDEMLAVSVLKRDDQVDMLRDKIFKDVLDHMQKEPTKIEQGLSLILIARNLERLGDHATNIAEDVIFAVSGKDIRHSKPTT